MRSSSLIISESLFLMVSTVCYGCQVHFSAQDELKVLEARCSFRHCGHTNTESLLYVDGRIVEICFCLSSPNPPMSIYVGCELVFLYFIVVPLVIQCFCEDCSQVCQHLRFLTDFLICLQPVLLFHSVAVLDK